MVFEYNNAPQGGGGSGEGYELIKISDELNALGSRTIDVKNIIPNYTEATSDDFVVVASSQATYYWAGGTSTEIKALVPTYNASTGIVTIPANRRMHSDGKNGYAPSYYVYYKNRGSVKPLGRKYILKDGVFVGQLDVDYKLRGTVTQNVGYVTHSGYQIGVGVYADFTKYSRLVFVQTPVSGTGTTSRMYRGATAGTHVYNTYQTVANDQPSDWYWSTPNEACKTYDIYLE